MLLIEVSQVITNINPVSQVKNFDFRNLQQAARKAKYCFSSIELLVNLTSNMAADCFEWAVEIMIFVAELIQHRYEYTSHTSSIEKITKN